MEKKRHYTEFDILRGMAILMVLLYHSVIVFPVNLHKIPWCRTLHTFLWVVQMPLFFLVSGFCYSYSGNYKEYARKKCMRILVPHVVFSLLDILPRILPNPLVNEQMDPWQAILDFVFYGGSDWFLWTLFVLVMLFPLFERFLKSGKKWRGLKMLLPVIVFAAKPYMTDFLLFNMVSQYFLYFFLGYAVREKAEVLLPRVERNRRLSIGFLGMVLLFAGFLACQEKYEAVARYLELLCVLCSFWVFYQLACVCRGGVKRFLTLCGTWSLQMYLLDAYALVATRTILVLFLGITEPVPVILGNFVLDTGIVLLITCFILTKARIFRIICGIPEKG